MKQTQIKKLFAILGSILVTTTLTLLLYKWVFESVWSRYQNIVFEAHASSDTQVEKEISLLKTLEKIQFPPPAYCSDNILAQMRATEFQSRWLKDISYLYQNKVLCTSRLGILNPPIRAEEFSVGDESSGTFYNANVPIINSSPSATERAVLVGNFQAFLRIPSTSGADFPWLKRAAYISLHDHQLQQVSGLLALSAVTIPFDKAVNNWYAHGNYYGRSCVRKTSCTIAEVDILGYLKYNMQIFGSLIFALLLFNALATGIMLKQLHKYMSLSNQLRRGLNIKQVICHYQPIMNIDTGSFPKVEVLSRWRNEDGELVRPDIFIGQIEKNGQTSEFTQVVFEKVISELKQSKLWGKVHFAINVYPRDLSSGFIKEIVDSKLKEHEKSLVTIEVTEQELEDINKVAEEIKQLRKRKCLVAIDDFGTGYSNFQHLEKLHVDALKIDKSFVQGIEHNSLRSKLTESIVEISKTLRLITVAEGVEQPEQLSVLRQLGVNYSQGFYHAKPMPIEGLITFLNKDGE